jgi:hypothetical protein
MNCAAHSCVVDEAHNDLAALFDQEGWARRNPVIANKNCVALVWVDFLCKLVDVDLVVVDRVVGYGVRNGPTSRQSPMLGRR